MLAFEVPYVNAQCQVDPLVVLVDLTQWQKLICFSFVLNILFIKCWCVNMAVPLLKKSMGTVSVKLRNDKKHHKHILNIIHMTHAIFSSEAVRSTEILLLL